MQLWLFLALKFKYDHFWNQEIVDGLQTGASFGNNQLFCQIKTKWRQNYQKKLQNETFCIDFQTL